MIKFKKNRREFFSQIGTGLTLYFLSNFFFFKRSFSKIKPKIVIIGMGIGGSTSLKYLNYISDLIDITVIDKNKKIRTGPLSNLVIGDILSQEEITFKMEKNKYPNVNFLYESVEFIDVEKKYIKLFGDLKIKFDFLILSPGIGYKENIIDGYSTKDKDIVPHCWDGDGDILEFKKRINDLENGSKIIISSPDYPYRCPPAPYERASLIANYLKKKKIKSKIIILDSKDSFTKKANFFKEWNQNFRDVIEWIPRSEGGRVVVFEKKNNSVKNDKGQIIKGDFIHIIPEQKAAKIFNHAELVNENEDWCQINPISFEIKGFKDIYAVGDSINAWDMPKSAFSANSQAKVLSINLMNKILEKNYIDPVFLNTCYSFSSEKSAFSISSWYRLNLNMDRIVSLGSSESSINADRSERKKEVQHAFGWYYKMVSDLFL